ncbi:hypothetical protein GQ607_017098 [Colletotrichum asianum]|uniref:Ubiquitin-like protease family profile domain-containing protein n=1 Tax=Colletotrichum asianum TaxID=702518 RepID=A0A8H3VSI1_9PEZI|nr:hypothetical protein GQ607_017098 [Colletotrichum asianum]
MDLRACLDALQSLVQHEDERICTLWTDFRRAWFEEDPSGHHLAFFLFAHDNVLGSIVEAYSCIEHSDAYASLASSPDNVQSRLNSTARFFYTTPHVLLEALGLDACSSRSSLEHIQTAQRQNSHLHLDDLIRAILSCVQRPKVIIKTLIRDAVKDLVPPATLTNSKARLRNKQKPSKDAGAAQGTDEIPKEQDISLLTNTKTDLHKIEPTEAECGPKDKGEIRLDKLSPLPKERAATPERYSPDLGLAGSPESPAWADSSCFPDQGSVHHSSDYSALEHSSPVITADTDARSASLFAATALAPSLFEDSYALEIDTPEPHEVPPIATTDESLETNRTRDVEVMANSDVHDDAAAAQSDKRQQPHDEEIAAAAAIRHACRIRVTTESLVEGLATLREHEWLNDTIVNVMLHRGVGSKMGLIDSLTLATAGHQRSERCRERLAPLLFAENVMMPSCDNSHWRLFVYNRPTHTISELDSLELRNNIAEEQVIPTLSWLYGEAWRPDVQVKKANAARQENGNNYGVFVIAFGTSLANTGSVPSRVNAPAWRRHLHQALLTSSDASVPVDMCASFSSTLPPAGADASTRATYRRAVGKKLRDMMSEIKANERRKTERHHERLASVLRARVELLGAIDGLIQLHATHQAALEQWLRYRQYLDTVGQVEEAFTEANRMAQRAIDLLKAAIPGQHSTTSGITVGIAAGAVELHKNNSSSMIRTLKRLDNDSASTCYPGLLYLIHLAASLCRCRYKEFRDAKKAFEEYE